MKTNFYWLGHPSGILELIQEIVPMPQVAYQFLQEEQVRNSWSWESAKQKTHKQSSLQSFNFQYMDNDLSSLCFIWKITSTTLSTCNAKLCKGNEEILESEPSAEHQEVNNDFAINFPHNSCSFYSNSQPSQLQIKSSPVLCSWKHHYHLVSEGNQIISVLRELE